MKSKFSFVPLIFFVVLFLIMPTVSQAWIKFTEEELTMQAPDWCADADAIALDKQIAYDVMLHRRGWNVTAHHTGRIKILSEEGKEYARLTIAVPRSEKIGTIRARTITPAGKKVKVKSRQIFKKVIYGGPENDMRIIVHEIAFPEVTEGAILEYRYETSSKSVKFIPPCYFDIEGLPTLRAELTFTIPAGTTYFLQKMNAGRCKFEEKVEEIMTIEGKKTRYCGIASQVLSSIDEPFGPAEDFLRPHGYFVFARYKNQYVNIDIVSNWAKGVEILVDEVFASFYKQTQSVTNVIQRIRANQTDGTLEESIFRWVADSIEFVDSRYCYGFNGTFDEKIAAGKATGVEKTLILKTLYQEIGSRTTLLLTIPATDGPVVTSLPALTQFTTYLLVAKINGEHIFLDPTKEGAPFGKYPWYLAGTHAIMVEKNNPVFVKIPPLEEDNTINWDIHCTLDKNGDLNAAGKLRLTNQFYLYNRNRLLKCDSADLKSYVADKFMDDCSEDNILRVELMQEEWNDTTCVIEVEWNLEGYAEIIEDGILLQPNCVDRIPFDFIPQDDNRKVNVHFSFPRYVQVRTAYELPENFRLTKLPNRVMERNSLGFAYKSITISNADENELQFERIYIRTRTRFQAGNYNEIRDFYSLCAEKDAVQLILEPADVHSER